MLKHIKTLVGVTFCNTWGINVARYSRDEKKIRNVWLMGFSFVLLACVGVIYISMLAYGLYKFGAGDTIPGYILMITSIVILIFSILKAGSVLFQMKTYDMLISLPIKPATIVVSRFLSMYISNVVLSLLTVVPSTIVYGIYMRPNALFYGMMLISVFLLPLIPMTIATAIGALIIAISSRMKHKNLITIILYTILTLAALIFSFSIQNIETKIDTEALADLSLMISKQIYAVYPPAKLFSQGVVEQNILSYLIFIVLSIGVFLILVVLVQWKFVEICSAINARATKNNFVMKEMKLGSALMAFYKKELRRYFSCSIYVMNTAMGYILLLVGSIALAVMGAEKLEGTLQMPGLITKALPLVISALCCITSTTVSAISLEGKQWWIPQSMPVNTKTVLDSKILVNLTIASPFLFLSEIILFFSVHTSILGYFMMVFVPVVYILFISVLGIAINLRMPMFNWEAEVTVVKQSGATLIAMIIGLIVIAIPGVFLVVFSNIDSNVIMGIVTLVLGIVTVVMYRDNNKKALCTIQ
ncbi:putative ABC transporter permease subunit [Anaerosporobacter sp.]